MRPAVIASKRRRRSCSVASAAASERHRFKVAASDRRAKRATARVITARLRRALVKHSYHCDDGGACVQRVAVKKYLGFSFRVSGFQSFRVSGFPVSGLRFRV